MSHRQRRVGVLAALLACACRPGLPTWCEAPPGATTSVTAASTASERPLSLSLIWEARPTDRPGPRNPIGLAIHPVSRIVAVADHVTQSVEFLAPDGTAIGRWSRPGRGSGEFSLAAALEWVPGGALAVLDPVLRKVIRLDLAGRYLDETPLASPVTQSLPDWWLLLRGQVIIGVTSPRLTRTDSVPTVSMHLLRASTLGSAVDTVLTTALPVYQGTGFSPGIRPGWPVPVAAPLEDGLLAVGGDVPEFRIRVLDPDGMVVRVICRVAPALPLSEYERRDATESGGVEPKANLARIGRLFSDGEGRIWVQRDRVTGVYLQERWFGPPGATFDVLDRNGGYVGRVRAPSDVRLAAAQGDLVIGFRTNRLATISVVAFRLKLAPGRVS